MDKGDFLSILKCHLEGTLPEREIDDVLNDYNEYFEAGTEEGKTEEQISLELGNPEDIVNELSADQKVPTAEPHAKEKYFFDHIKGINVAAVILFVLSLIYCLKIYRFIPWDTGSFVPMLSGDYGDIVFSVLLPIFLAFCGIHRLFVSKAGLPSKKQLHMSVILSIISMVLIAGILTLVTFIWVNIFNILSMPSDMSAFLPRTFRLIDVVFFAFVIIAAILILYSAGRHLKHLSFLFLLFGEFFSYLNIIYKFGVGLCADTVITFPARCFYPLVLGIVLSVLTFFLIKLKTRIFKDRT